MKKKDRTYRMYLEDIEMSIFRIMSYVDGMSFETFCVDNKTIDAVIRNFEIIGEASNNVPVDIKDRYSDFPWDEMYLMRNKIIQEYFGVDFEIVWDIINNYLPENGEQIKDILSIE